MKPVDLMLWVALPYASITVFVVGHVWRYQRDQLTWTTRSTQLLERRLLRWGVLLFHLGLLAVLGGHVLGILIPESWTEAAGISENAYHVLSIAAGAGAGAAMLVGLLILVYRRAAVPRIAATTTRVDRLTYLLLLVVVTLGMIETLGWGLIGGGYNYRETIGPWFRGIFVFDPKVAAASSAPLIYQIHAVSAWFLYALWPFSRLVHAWSIPFAYLRRAHILYRSRNTIDLRVLPGTEDAR